MKGSDLLEKELDRKNVLYLFFCILIFPFTELIVKIISLSVLGIERKQLSDTISDILLIIMCLIVYYSIDRKDLYGNYLGRFNSKYLLIVLLILFFSIVSILFIKFRIYEYIGDFFKVKVDNTLMRNNDLEINRFLQKKDKFNLSVKIIYLFIITPIYIEVRYRFASYGLLRQFIVYAHNEHLIFTTERKKILSIITTLIALVCFNLLFNSQHFEGSAIVTLAFVGLLTTLAFELTGAIWPGILIQTVVAISQGWEYILMWIKVLVD